jgi:hypothetical protein
LPSSGSAACGIIYLLIAGLVTYTIAIVHYWTSAVEKVAGPKKRLLKIGRKAGNCDCMWHELLRIPTTASIPSNSPDDRCVGQSRSTKTKRRQLLSDI